MLLPKPWFRKSKKAWYLQVARSEQLCLGKTKAAADRRYREWHIENAEALPRSDQKQLTIAEIGQEFLDHSQRHNDPRTYDFYRYFIAPFVERFGGAVAGEFLPRSFNKWLDEHSGWKGIFRGTLDVRARTITEEMALAAAHELARFAEAWGIRENGIVPRMDGWEVYPRVAVATAMKAQEQGLARLVRTPEQLHAQATKVIREAHDATRALMAEGLIPQMPEPR